jgi:hypothetical protein
VRVLIGHRLSWGLKKGAGRCESRPLLACAGFFWSRAYRRRVMHDGCWFAEASSSDLGYPTTSLHPRAMKDPKAEQLVPNLGKGSQLFTCILFCKNCCVLEIEFVKLNPEVNALGVSEEPSGLFGTASAPGAGGVAVGG